MNNLYKPPEQKNWHGREGALYQAVQFCELSEISPTDSKTFAILGFACDEGVRRNGGRVGAKEGPFALRNALGKLPLITGISLFDLGDIVCPDENLEEAQKKLGEAVSKILAAKMTPIILGGGHEVAFGHFQGLPQNLSIVNFDAHFDLRPGKPSSGTPFLQISESYRQNNRPFHYTCLGIQKSGNSKSLFESAKSLKVTTIFAEEFHLGMRKRPTEIIDKIIQNQEPIYLTICLDVFAAAVAPGVSAPQPLGLNPWHVIPLIRQLAASKKVISLDIAELSPPYDQDGRTAALAASLIWEFVQNS